MKAIFTFLLPMVAFGQSQSDWTVLKAGPFAVSVPADWVSTAIVEKVPLFPLFSPEGWKAFQTDKSLALKPSYANRPQHWAWRFPAADLPGSERNLRGAGDDAVAPQILLHKADEWGVVLTDGVHEDTNSAGTVRGLRRDMKAWQGKDLRHGSPGFVDASLTFACLKKQITFTGGRGIRLIVQWTVEPELIRRGELHYLFLGLSDDDSCQIIATFPLDCPGLPTRESEAEHLGRSGARYADLAKGFDRYEAEAKRWIEERKEKLTPKLSVLDAMMQSIVAQHWE